MVAVNQRLWAGLEVLALVGLTATTLESIPIAAAHSPAVPRGKAHHRHLAVQNKIRAGVDGQESKRGLVRKRADGTTCRVRGVPFPGVAGTTSVSTTPAPTTTSSSSSWSQTPTTTASTTPAPQNNNNNNNDYAAAPQQTTSTSQSWTPPSNNGGTGATGGWANTGSKFGAAWPNGGWADAGTPSYFGNYVGSKTSWYYTWSPFSVGTADALGVEFVPMLWGANQVSDWWAQQGSWPSTVKNALFFNEPNQEGQALISAQDAVSYWMNDFLPVRSKGIQLGGAATTSAPDGLTWIQTFMSSCTQFGNSAADCHMDFVPLHWYDTTPQNFQQYVQNFYNQAGQPNIWITEYACQNFNGGAQCSDGDTWYLHQQMAEWFDSQDYIQRYAPFGMMENMQGVNQDNALMNPDGSITSLGNWYIWNA